MSKWCAEPNPAAVDEQKTAFFGKLPANVLRLDLSMELLPGTWWRLEEEGRVVGYGWMDVTWGDGQVMLAVDPDVQHRGYGKRILDHLDHEAHAQGLAFMFNTIPPGHPDADGVRAFLTAHGFQASGLDSALLRRRVRR